MNLLGLKCEKNQFKLGNLIIAVAILLISSFY